MNASYLELTSGQVAVATMLILVNVAISAALRLGLGRSLVVASVRTVVQLLLIGLVLKWVFHVERWYLVLGLLAIMTTVAGVTAVQRNRRRYDGIWLDTLVSIWASSWIIGAFAVFAVMTGIDKWYQPQYAIPLMGMILGNTLNGASIGLGAFTEALVTRRAEVDTLLSLGATRWEACRQPAQHAIRTGMTPIINSMMVVGIVSLPGMMTGQLLSGVAPVQAVKYQIVIMFLIAAAAALGTTGVVLLGFFHLFTADHQFLQSRLATTQKRLGK
jgi:putative ABC transport system permease protein